MHIDNPQIWGETPLQKKSINLSLVGMPDRPIPERPSSTVQSMSSGSESDLGELAALFAAHSGGNFSAQVSADLALEIVLNEIVEQACLATGATGAAIILERDGEMVCRASSGVNAPEFGSRLGGESGLTAECIRTRQAQRCEDALTDPRADAEASRNLGVRSVVILPLLRDGGLAGLLEVFSSRAAAFGERDERTLDALAQRILKNLERAHEALSLPSITAAGAARDESAKAVSPMAETAFEDSLAGAEATPHKEEDEVTADTLARSPRAGVDVVTVALGAAVVVCALLLVTLVGLRLGLRRTGAAHGAVAKSAPEPAMIAPNGAGQTAGEIGTGAVSPPAGAAAENSTGTVGEKRNSSAAPSTSTARANEAFPPEGGLSVYENGKEVFRMPPTGEARAETSGVQTEDQNPRPVSPKNGETRTGHPVRASAVEPDGVVEVPPEVAEGSLLQRVEPEYPEEARQQQMQGAVVLEVRIGRDGAVQDVKLVSGQRLLADAAIAAVKQWRFKPRLQQGQAVEMQTRVTLYFRMPV
jgi:TonB family protein